ncbi:helix-turn-helix domain-containing protein [Shuttleworthella sp. MSX8B]|uniref:helix-turn-helix domain-containing protein n=1 Tax=Shuttleworthella sp. MSX8B TaxID=936574 RepID=UPI003FA7936F
MKEETGRNFCSILRTTRIDRACGLLNSTGQSIARISEEVGYENSEAFTRAFQRQMKMNPTAYRKSMSK